MGGRSVKSLEGPIPGKEIPNKTMKRILALDGGGIRGVFTLEVLLKMEQLLRCHYCRKDPAKGENFVLRDHFDFFAGTSTGAIIATLLCWGRPVSEILDLYVRYGEKMFPLRPWYDPRRYLITKFKAVPLTNLLQKLFLEADGRQARLGSKQLLRRENESDDKLLMVVVRNHTTGSAWPLTNNPKAKYNQRWRPDCNLKIPLWKLVRASTAAPTYFPVEEIDLKSEPDDIDGPLPDASHAEAGVDVPGPGQPPANSPLSAGGVRAAKRQVFMDGSITPYANPAAIAAMTAVLPSYHVDWTPGPENIRVVSVGTIQFSSELRARVPFWKRKPSSEASPLEVKNPKLWLGYYAEQIPIAFLQGTAWQQDYLCRCLGQCIFGEELDGEVGDLLNDAQVLPRAWFSYVRYNRTYRKDEMAAILRDDPSLARIDAVKAVSRLREIGKAYAHDHVQLEHLI